VYILIHDPDAVAENLTENIDWDNFEDVDDPWSANRMHYHIRVKPEEGGSV